jgi:hypothetical protein
MGLDVYVGTLTRYVVGDWELTVETLGRQLGIPVRIEHAEPERDDAIRDPESRGTGVRIWAASPPGAPPLSALGRGLSELPRRGLANQPPSARTNEENERLEASKFYRSPISHP